MESINNLNSLKVIFFFFFYSKIIIVCTTLFPSSSLSFVSVQQLQLRRKGKAGAVSISILPIRLRNEFQFWFFNDIKKNEEKKYTDKLAQVGGILAEMASFYQLSMKNLTVSKFH